MALKLEASKARRDAHISSLKRQLEADKTLHEAKVKRAHKAAKRELAETFQERITKAEEKSRS